MKTLGTKYRALMSSLVLRRGRKTGWVVGAYLVCPRCGHKIRFENVNHTEHTAIQALIAFVEGRAAVEHDCRPWFRPARRLVFMVVKAATNGIDAYSPLDNCRLEIDYQSFDGDDGDSR